MSIVQFPRCGAWYPPVPSGSWNLPPLVISQPFPAPIATQMYAGFAELATVTVPGSTTPGLMPDR